MSRNLYIHLRRGGTKMPVECVKITDDGVVVVFSDGNCCNCDDDSDDSCGDPTCPVCNPTRKE
jgi:hypothetical protein